MIAGRKQGLCYRDIHYMYVLLLSSHICINFIAKYSGQLKMADAFLECKTFEKNNRLGCSMIPGCRNGCTHPGPRTPEN